MEIVGFFFVWVLIAGSIFVNSVRSGEAPFILGTTVARSEDPILYWCSIFFWLCAFCLAVYVVASLSIHALNGTQQFRTRGLCPATSLQWVLAAADVFFLLTFAFFAWRRLQFNRLLREIEAEEKGSA